MLKQPEDCHQINFSLKLTMRERDYIEAEAKKRSITMSDVLRQMIGEQIENQSQSLRLLHWTRTH